MAARGATSPRVSIQTAGYTWNWLSMSQWMLDLLCLELWKEQRVWANYALILTASSRRFGTEDGRYFDALAVAGARLPR
jgi:hypothetical protein